jgi:hypothetical protein
MILRVKCVLFVHGCICGVDHSSREVLPIVMGLPKCDLVTSRKSDLGPLWPSSHEKCVSTIIKTQE